LTCLPLRRELRTIATDPSLHELYRTRFEGAPPKVRVRGGVVTVEYGPRFRPGGWGRQAAELTLNPSVGWRIEAPRGLEKLRADLRGIQLLGLEVQHATSKAEMTLPPTGRHGPASVRGGQRGHHPSPHRHPGQGPGDRGGEQGELR
jgi:hypothetical protein